MVVRKVGQDKTKIRKATCNQCGAKLEFYPKDIQSHSSSMGDYDSVYSFVVCPQCHKKVEIKTS